MTDDSTDLPRRRQASAEALAGREAARFVRDLNRQLGAWQASSVKLHAIALRLSAAGRIDPAVIAEAHALFEVVSTEAKGFEARVSNLSNAASVHGRIADTRRSFEMVADRLTESLKLLGSEPKRE